MRDWKTILASVLALLAAGFLAGNYGPTVIPKPEPQVVVVAAPPESWVTTDQTGKRIVSATLEAIAATIEDGTYNLTGVPKEAEPFQYRTVVVSSKGVVPPAPVIPPGPPVPPQPPLPPTPVVVPGKRQVVVLYESSDKSPELARVLNGIRNGASNKYLLDNGHEFYVLDADEKDESGQPSAVVKKFKEMAGDTKLPALIVQDLASGEILDKKTLPATDQAAIEVIKGTGG